LQSCRPRKVCGSVWLRLRKSSLRCSTDSSPLKASWREYSETYQRK
jgi:hypothetical protein